MKTIAALFTFLAATSTIAQAQQFLDFPISGKTPYERISSVLDQEVPHDLAQAALGFEQFSTLGPFGWNGAVLSFTGELFVAMPNYPMRNLGCYPKATQQQDNFGQWSNTLLQAYRGTFINFEDCMPGKALNYDNHPGYDYAYPSGMRVYSAAAGNIIFSKCIKTFTDNATRTCEAYGAVAIDHGNGYITQYLHMKSVYYGAAENGLNQQVSQLQQIGLVSNTSPTPVPVHLHFEVLKRKSTPVNTSEYYHRSNYVIVDPYGYNYSSYYASKLLTTQECLWKTGCMY